MTCDYRFSPNNSGRKVLHVIVLRRTESITWNMHKHIQDITLCEPKEGIWGHVCEHWAAVLYLLDFTYLLSGGVLKASNLLFCQYKNLSSTITLLIKLMKGRFNTQYASSLENTYRKATAAVIAAWISHRRTTAPSVPWSHMDPEDVAEVNFTACFLAP